MTSLTWEQVWARRLARHHLERPAPREELVEVVRAVCGVHAQVMPSAELAIGVRVAGATRRDVRDELWERRRLVKTYGIRGTVHVFCADELPLWLAALRANQPVEDPGRPQLPGARERSRGRAIVDAIGDALAGGRRLTREELGREVAGRVGEWAEEKVFPAFGTMWPRWWVEIGGAALAGVLCFGPNQGNRVTFVRPDVWLGRWEDVDGREALREVFRRYLVAYGPATPRDFAQWFNMDPVGAEDLARSVAGELREVDVEGWRAWLPASELEGPWPEPGRGVRLLPQFDGYVIGCHPRERLVPFDLLERFEGRVGATWARRALGGGSVSTIPTVLRGGVVAGVWERRRQGRKLELRVEPFEEDGKGLEGELREQADRVGEILEARVTCEVGRVEVRPHL